MSRLQHKCIYIAVEINRPPPLLIRSFEEWKACKPIRMVLDDCVLRIKTVQIQPFRTLMTALKNILLETNITFQKDGIRIINMDKSHTFLVY